MKPFPFSLHIIAFHWARVTVKLVLAAAMLCLAGCYTFSQAVHQNDLYNTRRRISDVINDPSEPEQTKSRLKEVQSVLSYGEREGLNTKGAYHYLIETKTPVVSYTVQAAPVDQLELISWWFPIIGRVPYLGYFERSDCDAKARELKGAGFDVTENGVGAFSSLGWFEDPIFSSMLARSDADIAQLFLHELTHRTLWVPGYPTFNENLAEFVAVTLTRTYLTEKSDRAGLAAYEIKRIDREIFVSWLLALREALNKLYLRKDLSKADLLKQKEQIFAEFEHGIKRVNFKSVDYIGKEAWNNASVAGAGLYAPDFVRFKRAATCAGASIKAFLTALERRLSQTSEPFSALDSLCFQKDALSHVD